MTTIACPLDSCDWALHITAPDVPSGTLADVFGPGVMTTIAANQHAEDVEAQLREHFRGHYLPDFLATITRLAGERNAARRTRDEWKTIAQGYQQLDNEISRYIPEEYDGGSYDHLMEWATDADAIIRKAHAWRKRRHDHPDELPQLEADLEAAIEKMYPTWKYL